MKFPNREAVEFNSRGQRPRSVRETRPTLKGSNYFIVRPFQGRFIRRFGSGGVATGY